ncbi:MAG TPA: polyprenol monophosphomannose synthase [Nitrospinota bacterium]|nr:polyprenol monophosphomannose synthase [Nitrospinota bacterium]|tara:strand:+ start:10518 stop:11228 length:711 start_codon:yes stop_codon:yes gene_type:complete
MDFETIVVIPTYNERENIGLLIGEIRSVLPNCSVLVVDDNSPDGTSNLVDEIRSGEDGIHLISRPSKQGLGSAYIAGFNYALDKKYKYIVQMDADHSHNPEYIPRLIDVVSDADLVLGSRYIPGGRVEDWPRSRKFLSRFGCLYSRLILSVPYKDLTGGFKLWKRETLQALSFDNIRSTGYSFQIEMTYRAHCAGFKIVEIPITFTDRNLGKSKMTKNIIIEAVYRTIQLRMRTVN